MLILIPTLVLWISNPNFLFGQIWAKKVKVVRFNWKLTQMVSDPKIHFWANLGRKNQSCLFFLKIGTHGILMMLILIPTLVFWISDPKSIFGKIWTKKVKAVQFGWKLAQKVFRRCWFLFRHFFSQFPTLNPFFGQIWIEKV